MTPDEWATVNWLLRLRVMALYWRLRQAEARIAALEGRA